MTVNDCFRILDLPSNAGLNDLKFAYRRKAKEYHPDHKGGDSRKFTRLLEAYRLLLDYGPIQNRRSTKKQDFSVNKETDSFYEEERKSPNARREMKRKAAEEKDRNVCRERDIQQDLRKSQKDREDKRCHAEAERHKKSPTHKARIFGSILSGTNPVSEKLKAIDSLVSLNRKSVYPYLKKGFYSKSEKVVIAVVEAVGKLGIVQAGPELSSMMCSGSPKIRMAVLETVSQFKKPVIFNDIIEIGLADRDKTIVRKSVILRSVLNG